MRSIASIILVIASSVSHAASDMSVSMKGDPPIVFAGAPLIYTVTVVNKGPDTANGVAVKHSAAPAMTISSEPSQGTCSKVAECEIGSLETGKTVTISIVTSPQEAGQINSSATVTSQDDPVANNNQANVVSTALPPIVPHVHAPPKQ